MELTAKLVITGKTIAMAVFMGTVTAASMTFGMQQVGDGAVSILLMAPAVLGVVVACFEPSLTWRTGDEQAAQPDDATDGPSGRR